MPINQLTYFARLQRDNLRTWNQDITYEGELSVYAYLANDSRFAYRTIYDNPVIQRSEPLSDLADRIITDIRDLNLDFGQSYERLSINYNAANVIDMPSIEDISRQIYFQMIALNRYATYNYVPYEFELATPPSRQIENYNVYIEPIRRLLAIRELSGLDIALNLKGFVDTPLGERAEEAYRSGLLSQAILRTQVLAAPILSGELKGEDFAITINPDATARVFADLASLFAIQIPPNFLQNGDLFGINSRLADTDSEYSDRLERLLLFTGKGQKEQLAKTAINPYRVGIPSLGVLGNIYVKFDLDRTKQELIELNKFGRGANAVAAGLDPMGVIPIFKDPFKDPRLISDSERYQLYWSDDMPKSQMVYTLEGIQNTDFNTITDDSVRRDSIYALTQNIVVNFAEKVFIRRDEKEFNHVIDGIPYNISRGDATTASGSWFLTEENIRVEKDEYFRVWTQNLGYTKLNRTLRHRGLDNGDKRSVLNDNGLANVAPTLRTPTQYRPFEDLIKRYMFSLENLAWADHLGDLPPCEQGVGDALTGKRGRIMWFPPYNLKITEENNANWEDHTFIGRTEPIYTYNNKVRSGTINFSIIADHPNIVNKIRGQKTQFWERYFKGDKLVEKEALDIINNNLTPEEKEQLNRARTRYIIKRKLIDKPKVTPKEKAKKTIIKPNDDSIGEKVISIYYPDNEVIPPITLEKAKDISLDEFNGIYQDRRYPSPRTEIFQVNPGYEDGGKEETIILKKASKVENVYNLNTRNGVKYVWVSENNKPKNKQLNYSLTKQSNLTYHRGIPWDVPSDLGRYDIIVPVTPQSQAQRIVNRRGGATASDIADLNTFGISVRNLRANGQLGCPNGYTDRNNLGLNVPFMYNYIDIIKQKIGDFKKIYVTVIGNASGAYTQRTGRNVSLAEERARNAYLWFVRALKETGLDVEIVGDVKLVGQADQEDKERQRQFYQNTNNFNEEQLKEFSKEICFSCDQPDKPACKKTRRADIYIKAAIEEIEEEPEPETPEDADNDPQYNPDEDEIVPDPDFLPKELDENLLAKLLYTECDFFNYLEVYEPAHYQTISERIKYFHPSYHSITPQGLNSRLTFLQQCTVPADNIGRDGLDGVRNFSFGRPPVCILRIGDFYHTKIIIESVSISYESQMTWDLNPEGIGVQPMYVDISLGIKILGGQSMASPLNRLQNALSFNFFANTEMYDIRSDSVIFPDGLGYDEKTGEVIKGKILDGIRISDITGGGNALANKNIELYRKQFRVALPNQNNNGQDFPANLNGVPSLLDLKRRLNLPMTEEEKKNLQIKIYDSNGKYLADGGTINNPDAQSLQDAITRDKLYKLPPSKATVVNIPRELENVMVNGVVSPNANDPLGTDLNEIEVSPYSFDASRNLQPSNALKYYYLPNNSIENSPYNVPQTMNSQDVTKQNERLEAQSENELRGFADSNNLDFDKLNLLYKQGKFSSDFTTLEEYLNENNVDFQTLPLRPSGHNSDEVVRLNKTNELREVLKTKLKTPRLDGL